MNIGTSLPYTTDAGTGPGFRTFPGFPPRTALETHRLTPRGAVCLSLDKGDLLSLSGTGSALFLVAFGQSGEALTDALRLEPGPTLAALNFDKAPLTGWSLARGAQVMERATAALNLSEPVFLKIPQRSTIWAILPAETGSIVTGAEPGDAEITVSRDKTTVALPEPLGRVLDEFTIHRGSARAYPLEDGQFVQIIDIEGQQCSDFVAFRHDGLDQGREVMIDGTATRSMVRRPYPQPGLLDKFFDQDVRPLLQVVQDTCGRHDTYGLACTARGYEDRGFPGHLNCSDNISNASAPFGVERRSAWPAINFFWNTWVDPQSSHILTEEGYSRAGDYVLMRAMGDLVCVSTACPDDIDPINGWNPTDVHVRIYQPDAPIKRAVAYRAKEDATMKVSRESAFHPRMAALTQDFAPARDLWMPNSYPATGALGEYWACRDAVTLQDMSGLRKYDLVGPDAEHVLQQLLTRDLSRLAQWRGTYALMCDETGSVVDDGTLFRLGPQLFRWCCGSEESARRIEDFAKSQGLEARLSDKSDALTNVALQGPKSRDLLASMVFTQAHVPPLEQLKWFGVTIGRLHDREGAPFMLSRSGYTGELGYELFCSQSDALAIWDALIEAGEAFGITPMGTEALDIIRIEAGLAAAGAEFAQGHDALESGLGFAVDFKKSNFVGKAALERNARDPRRLLKGLMLNGNDVPLAGAPVYAGERQVGQVTSATRSPTLECGIAIARLAVEYAANDTALEVGMMDGRMKRLPARVTDIPFVDPKRERARA